MKKIIALALALLLCAAMLLPASAESLLAGGWTLCEDITVTEEAKAAFNQALEGFVGSSIEPLALLGTQVVAGLNYCLLCRATPVVPNATSHYALVYIYRPLTEKAQLLEISDLPIGLSPVVVEAE